MDQNMGEPCNQMTSFERSSAENLPRVDHNRSPTSGSSSETTREPHLGAESATRRRRQSKAKRKRKWKPYTALSWDERLVQDDRETRRAFAKRQRLSAEGHPIAPYNTTQFLMDDHKQENSNEEDDDGIGSDELNDISKNSVIAVTENSPLKDDIEKRMSAANYYAISLLLNDRDSPLPYEGASKIVNHRPVLVSTRDEIQKYIMDDFSHTYDDCQAEQYQCMSKSALISECLKLEKRIEILEKKVKECQKRDTHRNLVERRLVDKINQMQTHNSQSPREEVS